MQYKILVCNVVLALAHVLFVENAKLMLLVKADIKGGVPYCRQHARLPGRWEGQCSAWAQTSFFPIEQSKTETLESFSRFQPISSSARVHKVTKYMSQNVTRVDLEAIFPKTSLTSGSQGEYADALVLPEHTQNLQMVVPWGTTTPPFLWYLRVSKTGDSGAFERFDLNPMVCYSSSSREPIVSCVFEACLC